MAKMTFEEFQASKLWYDDLARLPDWQFDERDGPSPGYGYFTEGGALYIDKLVTGEHAGMFDLIIGNCEYVDDDLAMLERKLYDFAISEGYCEPGGQLTWRQLSALENGARVRFVEAWDIFPITVVESGTLGTLTNNELNEITSSAAVLPDSEELRRALADWEGEVHLSPYLGGGTSHDEDEEWDALSPLALA